jgi:hypothetical protein
MPVIPAFRRLTHEASLGYIVKDLLTKKATQEAEIRRTAIQSQPGQIVCKTLSQKNPS